jgi:predicted  nucleic acid-binding Zn-ribbon protein
VNNVEPPAKGFNKGLPQLPDHDATLESLARLLTDFRGETREALTAVREDIVAIRRRLDTMEPVINGIPIINQKLTELRHEVRQVKTAVNDFAREQVTPGEIEALHADVNKTMSKDDALEARIATIEQRLARLEEQR